jgi:hypothetical protein
MKEFHGMSLKILSCEEIWNVSSTGRDDRVVLQ